MAEEAQTVPTVTVTVIFFDAERFIGEAVASIFGQTFADWELLLVDDGSTDRSTAMAREYAAARPEQVRYLEHAGHANRGMSASRNLGLAAARGRYVAFLDADDIYLPQRLERHVRVLDDMPLVGMVQGDCIKWHSWLPIDERRDDDFAWPFPCLGDRVLRPPEGLLTRLALRDVYVGICSVTVRREVALAVGGFEEEFRSLYEDEVFLSKVYLAAVVYARNEYVARYRIHPDSACGRVESTAHLASGPSRAAGRVFHDWLRGYVADRGPPGALLDRLLVALDDEDLLEMGPSVAQAAHDMASRFRRVADATLLRMLPRGWYQSIRRWRRDVATQRTADRYSRLCEQMTALVLNGIGRGDA